MAPPLNRPDPSFLTGEGEMARLIRGFDWAATSLGPVESWPASLKAMVRMALSTRHPVFIFWGPRHLCLYNDAYKASLGPEKHPSMLGAAAAAAWPEIWPVIGPQIAQVLRGDGPTWHENQLVPILRHGAMEDVYWTYSFGPIDDEQAPNGIGGVLVLCTETTRQVLTEQRLATEGQRLAQLFEAAPTFMAVLRGPSHVIELANPGFMKLTGNRPLLGRTVAEALPETAPQGYLRLLDEVYANGQAIARWGATYTAPEDNGDPATPHRVDFVYQPITDAAGAVTGIFVQGLDSTDQHAAEQALIVSEEQLRLATDAAEVGLWDVDLVADKLYWPPRVKAMFGISADVPVSMADYYAGLHEGDREATSAAFAVAMDPALRALYDVEYRTVGKEDGALRWVAAKGRGIFDADGRCTRVIGTAIDISRRKNAEARLRELNETLERRVAEALAERKILADIVENTAAFVQVLGLDFRWLAINRAAADEFERIFGVRPRVGDHMLELLAGQPEHQAAVGAVWRRALAGEEFTAVEAFGDPKRDRRHYEMRFNELRGAQGQRIGAYQFVYDVTERLRDQDRLAQAEGALRQAQKMEAIGQLTGGIAHDFNNLLQAVRVSFELIRRTPADAPTLRRLADTGIKVTDRGAKLTAQLLTFSRAQSLELRPVALARLFGGMADLLRTTLGPTVRLTVTPPPNDLWAVADATQLEMAMLNLAINARDAMPDGGELALGAHALRVDGDFALPAGDYVEVRVTDSGIGMPPDVVARAFDPFFTTKGVGKGSGLGLSQVYSMAQRAGGSARIETRFGSGTAVVMLLPRSPALDAEAAGAGLRLAAPAPTRPTTVLVVDDDDDVRVVLADALESLGFCVVQAEHGLAGLEALRRGGIDAMVVDFAMPGMNGAEVARLACEQRGDLPILFVSGYSDTAAIEAAVGPGADLLRKPFDIDTLEQVFARVMGKATQGVAG